MVDHPTRITFWDYLVPQVVTEVLGNVTTLTTVYFNVRGKDRVR